MTDERLKAIYAQLQARRAERGGACDVPPETMLEVLEGKLPAAERETVLLRIMGNPACRAEFQMLRALVDESPSRVRALPRRTAWALAAAAGLVLIVGTSVYERFRARGPEVVRETGRGAVVLVSPEVSARHTTPMRFMWRSVPTAVRYEFELASATGRRVFAISVTDTIFALPDSIRLDEKSDYRWWVEAPLSDGGRASSPLRALRLERP